MARDLGNRATGRRRPIAMRATGYLIGLIVFLLAFPGIAHGRAEEACGCEELTTLELIASTETLVDATVVAVDDVSERVAIATLAVHAVYAGSVPESIQIILDRDGGRSGPCNGTPLIGGVGVSGVVPLRRDGERFVADRCTLSTGADRFEADLPPVDFDATGGEARVIGFGAVADASVFALDSDGAVLAANRIEPVRAAVPCGAGPFAGLLLGARGDAPFTVGLLDVATLSIIETRTFPDRRSNGALHCTAAGELFAGIYEDDSPGGWLRVPRGAEAAAVIAEPITRGTRAMSGDRVATVAGGGMISDELSNALRLTVFDFTSGVSRTSPLDGPPDALPDDLGLSGDEVAVAFVRDSDGESTTEVWTYTLRDDGPEVTGTALLGSSPIDAATRQQYAAFGFTKSMQLVLPETGLVELAPDIARNITPIAIGVDGPTSILATPYGIATSVDGVITMLDTPFGAQRWLQHSVLLDGPVAVEAIEPDSVVARAPAAGAIIIDDDARSQLWRDYPVVHPPLDVTLDAPDDSGGSIVLIGVAAVAGLVAISVFIWRRRAGRSGAQAGISPRSHA